MPKPELRDVVGELRYDCLYSVRPPLEVISGLNGVDYCYGDDIIHPLLPAAFWHQLSVGPSPS